MDGRTDIQNAQVEFERAAVIDPSSELQHSRAASDGASDCEQLDAVRATLTATASAGVADSSSSPRLAETRHIPLAP